MTWLFGHMSFTKAHLEFGDNRLGDNRLGDNRFHTTRRDVGFEAARTPLRLVGGLCRAQLQRGVRSLQSLGRVLMAYQPLAGGGGSHGIYIYTYIYIYIRIHV